MDRGPGAYIRNVGTNTQAGSVFECDWDVEALGI
jgi:hypothetical protein